WLREVRAGSAVVLSARVEPRRRDELDDEVRGILEAAGASPVGQLLAPADDDPHAVDVVTALQRVLHRTWRVPDWSTAVLLHGREPDVTFVTPDGDVAGPGGYRGGEAPARSAVVTATAAEEAERRAAAIAEELASVAAARQRADAELATAKG